MRSTLRPASRAEIAEATHEYARWIAKETQSPALRDLFLCVLPHEEREQLRRKLRCEILTKAD